ncbi:MAG: hypothetical protein U1G05_19265 [Kiritimatiellia bacterium]
MGIGLMLGPFSLWMAWRFANPSSQGAELNAAIEQALRDMPETARAEAAGLDMTQMHRIMASRSFRAFLIGLTMLGVAFNVAMCLLCSRLARARSDALWAFVLLMGAYALYAYVLPMVFLFQSEMALSLGAAWGVGNMGVGLLLITYFWLWGPLLVIVGRGRLDASVT